MFSVLFAALRCRSLLPLCAVLFVILFCVITSGFLLSGAHLIVVYLLAYFSRCLKISIFEHLYRLASAKALCVVFHLIHLAHFMDEETEAQTG